MAAADVNVPINCVAGGRNLCIQGNPELGSLEYVLRQDGPTIVHAANISADETWAGDGAVHVIPSSISILAPATVTIQPCATVKLAPGASINVQGNLATGAVAKLVTTGAVVNFQDGSAEFQPVARFP